MKQNISQTSAWPRPKKFFSERKMNCFVWRALPFLLLLLGAETAHAHREDYIDETLVFQTVERGAIEPEYWFDYGYRRDSDTYFQRHNLAFEYGITALVITFVIGTPKFLSKVRVDMASRVSR